MIDKDQLRQLGWDENLIGEVTRMAEKIDGGAVKTPVVSSSYPSAATGSAVFLNPDFKPSAASERLTVR